MADLSETTIIRRRFIPDECIELNKDHIYELTPSRILTAWQSIKPRADISGGISAYYPEQGFKISRIYDHEHRPIYWYCDIISMHLTPGRIYFEDLLLDVVLTTDGQIKILDSDELADALEQGLISQEMACIALRRLNDLLNHIYKGSFSTLQQPVLELERTLFPTG